MELSLENHYSLSANGIDERYGNVSSNHTGSKIRIQNGNYNINDKTARTPGASDVNMDCTYTVNITGDNDSKDYKLIEQQLNI